METKKVVVEVESNLGSLKSQLREAQAEVSAMSEKFGATSTEAMNAAKAAARLKDTIGDAKAMTDAFNPDAKFKALTASLSGALNGFQAVEGAMGLFGAEGKEVQEMLLKVQSAMALAQGVDGLLEAKDAFKTFGAQASAALAKTTAGQWLLNAAQTAGAATMKVLNLVMKSNPIFLVIAAVMALVAAFAFFSSSTETAAEGNDRLNASLKRMNESIDESNKKLIKSGQDRLKLLESQGASEDVLHKTRLKNIDNEEAARKYSMKGELESIKHKQLALRNARNEEDWELAKTIQGEIKASQAKYKELGAQATDHNLNKEIENNEYNKSVEDAEKETNDKRLAAGKDYNDKRKAANDKAYQDWLESEKKQREELLAEESFYQSESDKGFEKEQERLKQEQKDKDDALIAERERIASSQQYKDEQARKDKERDDAEQARKKANILQGIQMSIDALSAIADISEVFAGQDKQRQKTAFNIRKAASIAQATMDTFKGVQSAFAETPGGIVIKSIAGGIAGAVGFANIAKIAKTQFEGGASSGGGGSSIGGGSMGGGSPQPANFNVVGNSNTNQLVQGLQNAPIQAFVVGAHVTNAQALDRNRIATASI